MKHHEIYKIRSKSGNAVGELPYALWFFFVCLVFPILGFVTLGFRCSLVYFAVRDSCYQAAKAPSFAAAQAAAKATLQTDATAWNGVHVPPNDPATVIVVRDLSSGVESESAVAIPQNSINPAVNMYLIRIRTDATVDPMINFGSGGFWNSIPGLTGPLPIRFAYQLYAENPNGL